MCIRDRYQAKIKKYDAEAATATDAVNETRRVEVQDMIKRINDYKENAQSDLGKNEADLMKPILEKIRTSMKKVAKEKGYQYLLNSSDSNVVLMAEGPDLTADIKKDLGF